MSLFCGGKKQNKGKRGKRDSSPAYGASRNDELQREKSSLEKEIGDLKEQKASLANQIKTQKDEVAREKKTVKVDLEIASVSEELARLKKEKNDIDREIGNLRHDKNELQKQTKALKEEFASAKKAVNVESEIHQHPDKAAQEEQLNSFSKKLEAEKVAKDKAHEKIKAIEEEQTKLKNEIDSLKKISELEKAQTTKAEDELDKYKKEKAKLEQEMGSTKKELELARKESHIPRSPTRAPSDEWKDKIDKAESELQKERELRLGKERENSRINSENKLLADEKQKLQDETNAMKAKLEESLNSLRTLEMNHKNEINQLQDRLHQEKQKIKKLDEEKDQLLTRLSSSTAAKVLDSNPNIADLSDPNRPQKIAEKFSQVYDDQWTDAMENLEKLGTNEERNIKILIDLLTTIYSHCKESSDNQNSRIEEDLFLPPMESHSSTSEPNGTEQLKSPISTKSHSKIPRFSSHKGGRPALPNLVTEKTTVEVVTPTKERQTRAHSVPKVKGEKMPEVPVEVKKGIKEYRKKVAKQVVPVIEKEVLAKLRRMEEFGDKVVDVCLPYIKKCVELCWMMCVQDPPAVLDWSAQEGAFNVDLYRAYTKSGSQLEFVVWPIIYLHEGGPVLLKGVAQGRD
ncbi:uncharacterized protein LOC127877437 isoform X1 [Dreissena polymorpha]|uniref:Mitochondria-eating protein n=1 Tax=Dreissena polymorpha TaxID=45954 RepID=A0A9D4HBW4_DREPO|nr:uncharacterized protein LOC127877437 isoform X1 [Dreissena polymorpha]KAH3830594.1 hypothetical protein DPMN_103839 [Dreissena polymorpha]